MKHKFRKTVFRVIVRHQITTSFLIGIFCLTPIELILSQDRKPYLDFHKEYIEDQSNLFDFRVPEVYELANIILALTEDGLEHPVLIKKETKYYEDVIDHFLLFKDHEIVKRLSISEYINFRENSYAYKFQDDKLVPNGLYEGLWNWNPVYMKANPDNQFYENLELIEDFAQKSGFRNFYDKHKPFYRDLSLTYRYLVSLNSIKNWLESKFTSPKYHSFIVVFSPLIGASHSADRIITDEFNQSLMFVSPPPFDTNETSIEMAARFTRIVFTEFDHNYVNPKSDKEVKKINQAMSDLNEWKGRDQKYYPSAYDVFNEYMTWVLFTLYVYDHFPSEVFKSTNETLENTMKRRGFTRFSEYNRYMTEWYVKRKKPVRIEQIYQVSLDWMKNE